ncbi:MAG: Uma2 family endonuclease [Candidatus Binatia bacterium]
MTQLTGGLEPHAPMKISVREAKLTTEQFVRLCQENRDFRFELTAQQELVIMPPAGSETGRRNSKLIVRVGTWAEADGTGVTFDSSTGFTLPNGAIRSPDASWIKKEKWETLSAEQQEEFAPLCPDFVIELRSPSDRLSELQAKMQEYIDNGALLGWLLDPQERRVYIYRPNLPIEILDDPAELRGDPVLPGFVLAVREVW